jgi:hypothetical protein
MGIIYGIIIIISLALAIYLQQTGLFFSCSNDQGTKVNKSLDTLTMSFMAMKMT